MKAQKRERESLPHKFLDALHEEEERFRIEKILKSAPLMHRERDPGRWSRFSGGRALGAQPERESTRNP